MDPRAAPLALLLRLNARLVRNCFDGVTDAEAAARPLPPANGMAFLLAHLIDARHALLAALGGAAENPVAPFLANARSADEVAALPPLAELLAAWNAIDAALADRLAAMDAASLDAPAPQRYPGGDDTVLGALSFLVQHDSYHLGQLAMLRRTHGHPAMRYGAPRTP